MVNRSPIQLVGYLLRSRKALQYGYRNNIIGSQFARFGTSLGRKLLLKRVPGGFGLLVAPVSITRYFEFQFVEENVLPPFKLCLDLSSPRLFSLYLAAKNDPPRSIKMCNPDAKDIECTRRIAEALHFDCLTFSTESALDLRRQTESYDCIWSISVIEHVAGEYDDSTAIQLMFDALKPGGYLILTVPTDKYFWNEYRPTNYYGTQPRDKQKGFFFQRFYDLDAIKSRLLEPIQRDPKVIRWYGEKQAGTFQNYIERILQGNSWVSLEDPVQIVDHYAEYSSFSSMPGAGVCGLVIEK